MNDWDKITGFSKKEFEPPYEVSHEWDMHPTLIKRLQLIRDAGLSKYTKFRIIIHENGGYSTQGHSKTSLHYGDSSAKESGLTQRVGRAVDLHCETWSETHKCWVLVSWFDQVFLIYPELSQYEWGLGLHPEWNSSGFHLDYRGGCRNPAVWWKGDEYKSYPFSEFTKALEDVIKREHSEGRVLRS